MTRYAIESPADQEAAVARRLWSSHADERARLALALMERQVQQELREEEEAERERLAELAWWEPPLGRLSAWWERRRARG